MSLLDRLAEDLKNAIRNRDEIARETVRLLKSELTQKEIELGKALTEADEIAILSRAVKTRKDTITQYEEGGRKDLADKERAEIVIIEQYLPKAMTEEEATVAVTKLADELGVSGKKDMGKLMKAVTERYRGQIDGKTASRIAQTVLSAREG